MTWTILFDNPRVLFLNGMQTSELALSLTLDATKLIMLSDAHYTTSYIKTIEHFLQSTETFFLNSYAFLLSS